MASITIGGKPYLIPEMNFVAIERGWPYVEKATSTLHPMDGVSASLGVFAAGIMEADYFKKEDFNVSEWEPGISEALTEDEHIHKGVIHFLKKGLKGSEMDKVRVTMFEVLKEAGLEVTEGEVQNTLVAAILSQEEDQDLFEETALSTSPNSSQPAVKEETGTS